jgi:hypothetical protein
MDFTMGVIIQPSGQGDAQGDALIRVNAEDDVGVHSFYLLTRQAFTVDCDWKLIQDFTLPAELME